MINYTIIIPHKNIPTLLQRCLDSIPRREDVQIIVVDDNSDADKVDFANFPGLKDTYVEVIFGKNENGRKGAGYARNLGLERAKGKWITFVDADDFFMPCFNDVLNKYVDDENDIVYFKLTSVDSDTLQPATRHQYIINCLNKIQETNNWDFIFGVNVPHGRFIKRNIIVQNNIKFQETQYSNDVLFGLKLSVVDCTRIIIDDEVLCITCRKDSLMGKHTLDSMLERFNVVCNAVNFLKTYGKKNYIKSAVGMWWLKIYKEDSHTAIKIIPKMINSCGFLYTVRYLRKNNFRCRQIIKKIYRMLKNVLLYRIFLYGIFPLIAVFLVKTVKNYFREGNSRFKDLLLKLEFYPSIVYNPFIVFNKYNSMPVIYFDFWAKFVLKTFLFAINNLPQKKLTQLLIRIDLKQAFIYNVRFLIFDEYKCNRYKEIEIPVTILEEKKVVVYSVMIGDYDEVLDPVYVSDNCDYILFTNNANIKTNIWKIHFIQPDKEYSNKWNVLYYKILAHKVLPQYYDYSIYLDAKVLILGNITELVKYLNHNCNLVLIKHFARYSLKQEIDICIKANIVSEENGLKQYEDYIAKGFPDNLGLIDSCILVRNHNDVKVQEVMETWFEEFTKYPTRDQFSIMYSIWKNAMKNYCIIDGCVLTNQLNINKGHKIKQFNK